VNYESLTNLIVKINTEQQSFNMQNIRNRRFMYNPTTGTLILGRQYAGSNIYFSHAEEYAKCNIPEPYDDFIRGWVGTGNAYKDGVIHFTPAQDYRYLTLFERAFDTLLMFRQNGANESTLIRGFGDVWEQPLSAVLSPVPENGPVEPESDDDCLEL